MKTTNAAAFFAAIALTTVVHAAPITGTIELSSEASTITIDYGLNTVSFSPTAPDNNTEVAASSGSMSVLLPVGTLISYQNFSYDPLSVTNPIWTSGNTWFNLSEVTSFYEAPNGNGLLLFGKGTINTNVAGYETTAGDWSFSADRANNTTKFSWSSTASATSVPDGGSTIALLSTSILGLGGARRFIFRMKK